MATKKQLKYWKSMKGHPQYNTGRTHFKKGEPCYWKGKKFSPDYKKKLSEAHLGQIAWNKGLKNHLSKESIEKLSIAHRGNKSSTWKGGVTPLSELIRNLPEYKEWRIAVSKKYDKTCQECKLRSNYNHSHHKKSLAKILQDFLKEYDQFSPIEDIETLVRLTTKYKPFWDLNNGIVLCKSCHTIVTFTKSNADVD